ncbi:MAG TPA: 6-carboxytetrahydropterin synthase [Bacteroidales bacterium]|nr:6-carboxytetrahydropterin synthase [Bacteroidales bacterium]
MIFLTRRERFNAAHRMYRADWDDEKNLEVFGKCSNPNWHGHNYELFVTVKGMINPDLGYVVNLKEVSRVVREKIIDKLDHKNVNLEVAFMKDKIASTENLAIGIWEELEQPIRALGVQLYRIKLCETENNYVEFFGH